MVEATLIEQAPSPRLALALHEHEAILASLRKYDISMLDVLHQCEALLMHDSLEWDFAIHNLTKTEYDFLHAYSNLAGDISIAVGTKITIPMMVEVLKAVYESTCYIEKKLKANPGYSPERDEAAFEPRNKLAPVLQTLYDVFPITIEMVASDAKPERQYGNTIWFMSIVENCLHAMQTGLYLITKKAMLAGT